MTRTKAMKLRMLIEAAMNCSIGDEDALEGVTLFPVWSAGQNYEAGVRVRHGDVLYKCLQSHTAQSDWAPDGAVSLWSRVLATGDVTDWAQPDSTNGYGLGELVRHNEKIWKSTLDNNVWEPGVYGWEEQE